MRTIGRWSIASVINFFISLTSFGAACGVLFAVCFMLAVPCVRLPITVTVPVSFTVDTPDQVLGGRTSFAFEFRETPSRPPRARAESTASTAPCGFRPPAAGSSPRTASRSWRS